MKRLYAYPAAPHKAAELKVDIVENAVKRTSQLLSDRGTIFYRQRNTGSRQDFQTWFLKAAAQTEEKFCPSLTGCVVVDVVLLLAAVHPQKHLIVVVFVPVEGQDTGAPPFWVSAEKAGHARNQLGEG